MERLVIDIPHWLHQTLKTNVYRQAMGISEEEALSEVTLGLLMRNKEDGTSLTVILNSPLAHLKVRWILLDVYRKHVRHLRHTIIISPENLPAPVGRHNLSPERMLARNRTRRRINQLYARFSRSERRLFKLRLLHGHSERKIAQLMSLSTATTHRRWAALRKRIFSVARIDTPQL